jgi:hypothetical protein
MSAEKKPIGGTGVSSNDSEDLQMDYDRHRTVSGCPAYGKAAV